MMQSLAVLQEKDKLARFGKSWPVFRWIYGGRGTLVPSLNGGKTLRHRGEKENKRNEKENGEKRQRRPPSHSNCENLEVDSPLYIMPHLETTLSDSPRQCCSSNRGKQHRVISSYTNGSGCLPHRQGGNPKKTKNKIKIKLQNLNKKDVV